MPSSIGAKIELSGAESFRRALTNINAVTKNVNAQMKALAADFTTAGKNADYLKARNTLLTSSLEQQGTKMGLLTTQIDKGRTALENLRDKVDVAQRAYDESARQVEKATAIYGENSEEVKAASEAHKQNEAALERAGNTYASQATKVQNLERQYYEAEASVNSMTAELEQNESTLRDIERGYNDAGNQVDEFGQEVKGASNDLEDLGDSGERSAGKLAGAFVGVNLALDAVRAAVSTLKKNISGAFDRIDAETNFTKRLTVLKYTTEEANQALDKTREILADTPYTLSTVSAGLSSLLSTTRKTIDEGVSYVETWTNAVAAMGDASDNAFETVVDAMNNQLATGKYNYQQTERIVKQGIYVYDLYAEKVGMSVADVKAALSSGKIDVSDFFEVVTDALNTGTENFDSVAGAAKGAGETYAAAFSNFTSRIQNGLKSVITATEEALANSNLPTIKDIINQAGMAARDALQNLAQRIPEIIQMVQRAYTAIQPFLPLITGLVAAFAASDVVNRLTESVGALKTALSLLAAHPIIAILAGITAFIIHLWNTNEDFRNGVIAIWEGIKNTFVAVGEWFGKLFTETIPRALLVAALAITGWVGSVWETAVEFFTVTLPGVFSAFTDFIRGIFTRDWSEQLGSLGDILNAFLANVKNIWEGIKGIFTGIVDFIKNVFSGNWKGAWEAVVNIFRSVFETVVSIAKVPLNAIIGFLNAAITGINTLIAGINKISFDVPDWVPGLGGKKFGFTIPAIPKIPHLAKGAVIPPGREFLAMLGDQPRGYNLEAPEGLIRKIVREESGGSVEINVNVNVPAGDTRDLGYWQGVGRTIAETVDQEMGWKLRRERAALGV